MIIRPWNNAMLIEALTSWCAWLCFMLCVTFLWFLIHRFGAGLAKYIVTVDLVCMLKLLPYLVYFHIYSLDHLCNNNHFSVLHCLRS